MALLDPIDIVNAACALIGDDPLQNLDEDTIGGQPAALLYEKVVDFNLGLPCPWDFAERLFQLSRNDQATAWAGYTYVYDLPPERLDAPNYVTDNVTSPERRFHAYAAEGDRLHSNATALWAMCTFRPAPHLWSATFRVATITALAARLALARAHDKGLSDRLDQQAYGTPSESRMGGEIGAAMSANGFGKRTRPQNRNANPLLAARRIG